MTRNEELATAFEAAARAADPHQDYQTAAQQAQMVGLMMPFDPVANREGEIVCRVLAAIGGVYRKLADIP